MLEDRDIDGVCVHRVIYSIIYIMVVCVLCNAGALCVNMQCGGGASGCKMATSDNGIDDGVLFGGVEWSSSPVTFHWKKGFNVELTESNTVATRTKSHNNGVVFTSKPMVAGHMLKVTMTEKEKELWGGGMVRAHLVCALLGC